ncbi:VTT domain-containing protein [Desulfosporosinus sp.]|uniref:TVP38/TMEM64 family protein n=1 Tax=Desulfosporosinus sp. TaxID=157907 RepID=UPI0025B7E117|nr:VTT domain-containing protein [Desulfosporosinus sp.]MBC2727139.1 TVP38/TMEM64 family protein [Desulfosporosinus sp.]
MSSQFFADSINYWGAYGIIASLFISILIAVAGIIPSIFVTGANVIVFGPVNGFIISWVGEVIGALVSFYLYRLGFKKRLERLGRKHIMLDRIVSAKGFKITVLLFQARLLPFIPSGFVTLAGAVSNIYMLHFLIATALGKLPSLALEALVSFDIININTNWIRLTITIFALVSIILLLRKRNFGVMPNCEAKSGKK